MKTQRNSMAAAAATSLVLMTLVAPMSNAAPPSQVRPISMRNIMKYTDGAWIIPVAIVLRSEQDWLDWNREMAAEGKAIAEEALSSNVNWTTESLLVVALGACGQSWNLELGNPRRTGLSTEVTMNVGIGSGGDYPCHVVALNRSAARNLRLRSDIAIAGLSPNAPVPIYQSKSIPASLAGADAEVEAVPATWGQVKDEYR